MITTKKISLKIYKKGNGKRIKAVHMQNIDTNEAVTEELKDKKAQGTGKQQPRQK